MMPIASAIERNGFFRRSKFLWEGQPGHKEWLHFAIHGEGLDLLANFSVVDDTRAGVRSGTDHARLVCLVREQQWSGDIDHFEPAEVSARGGELALRFAHNRAVFQNGGFDLHVRMKRLPITLDLRLEPLTMPAPANNIVVDDCPPIQWLVVPRLLASGAVQIDTRRYELQNATAYHDHNWGSFRWGKNFAWEWGYASPDSRDNPWTLVFVRLTNRSHLTDLMQAIFLWKGARQERVFRADDLTVWHEGLLRPRRIFKLPRVMALASPAHVTDVPKTLVIRARRGDDWLDVRFDTEDLAQVIIPNDDDLGVTIIHEVSGQVAVEGKVGGEPVSIAGPSIFEFLGE